MNGLLQLVAVGAGAAAVAALVFALRTADGNGASLAGRWVSGVAGAILILAVSNFLFGYYEVADPVPPREPILCWGAMSTDYEPTDLELLGMADSQIDTRVRQMALCPEGARPRLAAGAAMFGAAAALYIGGAALHGRWRRPVAHESQAVT